MPVEITEDSIVLKSKAGSITLCATDTNVGIYIENDKGQMNLCSQPGMPPYICFYHVGKDGKLSSYPSAITTNDDGAGLTVQFGNHDPRKVSFVDLKDALKKED